MTGHTLINPKGNVGASNAGADFVGGCCGTTPEFISAIARRLR